MYIYIFLYFFLAMLGLVTWSRGQTEFIYFILYILFVLFVGTRFDTGCDFYTYFWRFKLLKTDFSSLTSITEPGYFLFSVLIKKAGLDFVWVNVFGAAIFFYYVIKFSRNHPRPLLLIALLFPLLVIQLSMSGLRQALAVAFLFGALDAFIKGKRTAIVIYILIGSTFHQSVIILLPIALMVGRTFSLIRVIGAIVILMPVAVYLLSDRMDIYQDRYIEELYGEMSSGGAIFRLGLLILTASVFELYRKNMARIYPKEYNLMRVFSLVSFALVPVMLVNSVAVHRLIYYVVPIQVYILAALPAAIFKSRRVGNLAGLVPIALYAAYLVVWFSLSRHANICYVPYDSYLL